LKYLPEHSDHDRFTAFTSVDCIFLMSVFCSYTSETNNQGCRVRGKMPDSDLYKISDSLKSSKWSLAVLTANQWKSWYTARIVSTKVSKEIVSFQQEFTT